MSAPVPGTPSAGAPGAGPLATTLTGRHVVVTGATGGLGRAVAEHLLALGAVVHLPCRDASRLAPFDAAERVHAVGGVDLSDERSVASFYADLPSLWGSVHCVGAFRAEPIVDTELAALHAMHDANTVSTFLCCREAVRKLRAVGGGGRIVNVTAEVALEPRRGAGLIAYAMSKAAVAALTTALAQEVGAEGLRVNAIAPAALAAPAGRDRPAAPGLPAASVARTLAALLDPSLDVVQGAVLPLPYPA